MKLVIDTDAFCKLQIAGLWAEAGKLFGGDLAGCGRLAALPHMLRRGKLRRHLGDGICDDLLPFAEQLPVIPAPSGLWLEKLVACEEVDPGEAQLFACAVETDLFVVSGDKRALRAIKAIDGIAEVLAGRIVVLEALLLGLYDQIGAPLLRERMSRVGHLDSMMRICSASAEDLRDALVSYFESLQAELQPLIFWDPRSWRAP